VRPLIESLGVYLPPRAVSTAEILDGCRTRIRFPLEKLTGIRSRRMAGDSEFSFDLAWRAANDCLAGSRHRPEEIDLLISCSISRCDGPEFRVTYEPSTAVRLAARLGSPRALAFDISSACTGMFTGLLIADAFIRLGLSRCAMVVSGEYITHLTRTAQQAVEGFMDSRLACLTLGDAGAAVLLEPSEGDAVGLHAIDMVTLGRYSSYCIAKATEIGPMMFTDSVKITEVAVLPAVMHTAEILRRDPSLARSVQHLVLHQTSRTTLRDAARVIDQVFPGVTAATTVIDNLGERGNTASTSHFVAVMDHILNGRIGTGDTVVFGISGSGQTLGTALYTFDDLPDRVRRRRAGAPAGAPATRPFASLPVTPGMGARASGATSGGGGVPVGRRRRRIRLESLGIAPEEEGSGRTSFELGRDAGFACLQASTHEPGDIELLIHAGVYRTEHLAEPAVAAILAGELGINDVFEPGRERQTLAFDVLNGSAGFLQACYVAGQLILAGRCRTAMVVAAEAASLHSDDDGPRRIASVASAVILDEAEGESGGFESFRFRSFPAHVEARRASVSLRTSRARLEVADAADLEERYVTCILEVARELLADERLALGDLRVVLAPQISSDFVERLAGALGVPRRRCVDAASQDADLFTSSLPYALRALGERGSVAPGDIGLIIGVGAGVVVGCALYRF
jgi:3-oxoacyl-[acyl-carrier-protein] synthase III